MKKLLFLVIPILFWGCEKTYDNIIDVVTENYQVTFVSHPTSLDLKNPGDSLLSARIKFTRLSQLQQVFFDVIASDNSVLNPVPIEMFDISDNLFSAQFILKREYPNGKYILNFTAKGSTGESKLVATSSFDFNNGQDNFPPVISNLVAPDTVAIGSDTTFIQLTIDAEDGNGLNDLEFVWFDSYLPNGNPSSQNPIAMYDDGTNGGDVTAGDGKYSSIVILPPTGVARGSYRWEFRARDRSGTLSNLITHFLEVI
jgi:hypothetical protein